MEAAPLLPSGDSAIAPSWPVVQPPEPLYIESDKCCKWKYAFSCGCCSFFCYSLLGLVIFALLLAIYPVLVAVLTVLVVLFGWLAGTIIVWLYFFSPPENLVWKVAKLIQLARLTFYKLPKASEWQISALKPKGPLPTGLLQYAIAIRVPFGNQDEFYGGGLFEMLGRNSKEEEFVTENFFFNLVPVTPVSKMKRFKEGESPVEYAMDVCRDIYPRILQEWNEKTSDRALTHFCKHGLAAHRVEKADASHPGCSFVVKTNQMAVLPVREGYDHYGNDVYFDKDWRVVKIVRLDQVEKWEAQTSTTFYPDGSRDWEYAKFCFRCSLFTLVTFADHLYGCHLQAANITLQAAREQLSTDHPLRRFLVPFSYGSFHINDQARAFLVTRDSFLPRATALDDEGLQIAWASAHKLLPPGFAGDSSDPLEQLEALLDREAFLERQRQAGLWTPYFEQALKFWKIMKRFVTAYLDHYYGTGPAGDLKIEADQEVRHFLQQGLRAMEALQNPMLQLGDFWTSLTAAKKRTLLVNFLTRFCDIVTAGHEQVGAIQAYGQDASFCAFSWPKSLRQEGVMAAPKEVALGTILIVALTSTPMPPLLARDEKDDWSHLFPAASEQDRQKTKSIFKAFQADLKAFSVECDEYNARTNQRSFPDDFGLWVFNPKNLETSVSI